MVLVDKIIKQKWQLKSIYSQYTVKSRILYQPNLRINTETYFYILLSSLPCQIITKILTLQHRVYHTEIHDKWNVNTYIVINDILVILYILCLTISGLPFLYYLLVRFQQEFIQIYFLISIKKFLFDFYSQCVLFVNIMSRYNIDANCRWLSSFQGKSVRLFVQPYFQIWGNSFQI